MKNLQRFIAFVFFLMLSAFACGVFLPPPGATNQYVPPAGSSGTVLTSNGTGKYPVWKTPSGGGGWPALGVTTGVPAASGVVGEYLINNAENSASAVSGASYEGATLTLSPGIYDLVATCFFSWNNSDVADSYAVSQQVCSVDNATQTYPGLDANQAAFDYSAVYTSPYFTAPPGFYNYATIVTNPVRVVITSPTAYYAWMYSIFTVVGSPSNTPIFSSDLRAIRVY